jgi:hypothetical protein
MREAKLLPAVAVSIQVAVFAGQCASLVVRGSVVAVIHIAAKFAAVMSDPNFGATDVPITPVTILGEHRTGA